MLDLYSNYVCYVLKNDDLSFTKIVKNVLSFLKKRFKNITTIDREDLIQEVLELISIKFKLLDFTVSLDMNEEELLRESINNKIPFSDSKLNDSNYVLYRFFSFNKEQMNIYDKLMSNPKLINGFKLLFESYLGNAKIINYISKICDYKILEYNRKQNYILSLNRTTESGDEYINLIEDVEINNFTIDDLYMLNKDEVAFLKSFYKYGYLKMQDELAIEHGVTQQSISKKFKKIKNKVNDAA